jgi:hypothetical protein
MLSVGCASNSVTKDEYSGYLTDYSKLKQVNTVSGNGSLRWISSKLNSTNYHSIMFDKSTYYPEPKPTGQVSGTLMRNLSWALDKSLSSAARGSFKVVTQPGEGVLRIKPAITGVVHSAEGFQPIEILPIALVLGAGKLAAGTRDQDVEVYLEVAVTDSQTNELLATVVRKGQGAQLENEEEQLTMEHLQELVKNWKVDARDAFSTLANN